MKLLLLPFALIHYTFQNMADINNQIIKLIEQDIIHEGDYYTIDEGFDQYELLGKGSFGVVRKIGDVSVKKIDPYKAEGDI